MKIIRKWLVSIFIVIPLLCTVVFANEEIGFHADVEPAVVNVGEEVTMTVAFDNYTAESEAILMFQIDIENVDPDILEVLEYSSLIEDPAAISNTGSYHTDENLVRLLFVKFSGALAAPCDDVFKVRFRINPDLKEGGSITLPVTMMIQAVSGKQITLNKEYTINYEMPRETTNVDISWGALNYTYSEGIWNPDTHCYEGAGWDDEGSGFVTVQNNGEAAVEAEYDYTSLRSEITGSFTDQNNETIDASLAIEPDSEQTVYLKLSGKPDEFIQDEKIGTVTVTIRGD